MTSGSATRGMKTPLSPSPFLANGQIFLSATPTTADYTPQQSQGNQVCKGGVPYSLCQECNVQLTSASQALLHYNGRSHLRRLRQNTTGGGGGPGPSQPQSPPQGATSSTLTSAAGPKSGLNPLLTTPATGSGCLQVGGALPGLIAGGGASVMMQSSFLSFPVDNSSPVSLFNYNTMDPVQKAVINHTFGVTMATRKKQLISCNVCQLRFNSDSQAEAHYKGSRHAKKVKGQENKTKVTRGSSLGGGETNGNVSSPVGPAPVTVSTNQCTDLSFCVLSPSRAESDPPPSSPPSASPAPAPPAPPPLPGLHSSSSKASPPPPPPPTSSSSSSCSSSSASLHTVAPTDSEEEKAKKLLYCSLCKVAVNSLSQLDAHNTGSKHKTMMEARSGAGPIKAFPRPGAKLKTTIAAGPDGAALLKGSGLQNKTFHCQICDVHVNSEIQLKQHISSRRHKDRVAGKPMKPKYSPYNKQRSGTTLTKDLVKPPITQSSILSSPFCPPTSLASSSLPLMPSSPALSPSLALPPSSLSPSFSLHPRPCSSPLFGPSFLRPAPGPIRTVHRPILFAPY